MSTIETIVLGALVMLGSALVAYLVVSLANSFKRYKP